MFSTQNWVVLESESLIVTADRDSAVYQAGEVVTFRVQLTQDNQPIDGVAVAWSLLKDGGTVLQSGYSQLTNGEAYISGKLDTPGFIQLRATYTRGTEVVTAMAGAGVDPTHIPPSLPVPDDFDAFWNEKKTLLARVPMNPNLTPVNSGVSGITAYDVQVDCIGAPVSGYLSMPTDAQPGTLPAIITLHGAGTAGAHLYASTYWSKYGMLALDINAHGILNGQPDVYYDGLKSGPLANYTRQGKESRDDFYFLGMFLRVIRAIDYLSTRPEWDGRTLILYGTSQGGAQSYAGAGLDSRVSFFVAGVAAMADLTGTVVNRPMGWPGVGLFTGTSGKSYDDVMNVLRYFDAMNFATRVKADGFFTVGFVDTTCPPTAVYAAYNNVQTNKTIYNDILSGHINTPEATQLMREAVLAHVEKMKQQPER